MIKDSRNDKMLYQVQSSFMDDVISEMEKIDINIDDFDHVYSCEVNNEQNKKKRHKIFT